MVGLLIITHNQIGHALLDTATQMLGMCPLLTETLAVPPDGDPEQLLREARARVERLDRGAGVLVLTDIYGSTPSNIATRLADGSHIVAVSGINLPMLVRVMNYPRLHLAELAIKAETGGCDGIFPCTPVID